MHVNYAIVYNQRNIQKSNRMRTMPNISDKNIQDPCQIWGS